MNHNQCILCNSREFILLFDLDSCRILKCQDCSLVFTELKEGSLSPEELNERLYSSQDYNLGYLSRRRELTTRFSRVLNEIKRLKDRGKVLDIGCSFGFFLDAARKFGWDCTGIELSSSTASYARNKLGLNVINKKLMDIKFSDQKFDLVTLWDVLEHMPQPINELKEINRILKNDGLLFIQSPNIDSLMATRNDSRWSWLTPPYHLYHFSISTLKRLLEKADFKVIKIKTWEPYSALYYTLFPFACFPAVNRWENFFLRAPLKFGFWLLYPLLKPFQIIISKLKRGGLLRFYAIKRGD